MKKFFVFIFVIVLLATLVGCGKIPTQNTDDPTGDPEEKTFETRKTPIMGWASWNAYRTVITEESMLFKQEC